MSSIKLDRSPSGIVIHCEDHPWWRAFRFHKEDAWDAACRHEEDDHDPTDRHQRNAREQRRYAARKAAERAAREAHVSGTSATVRMV